MDKYDGWTIKNKDGHLLLWSFSDTRTEIVQDKAGEKWWRKNKRDGCKIVKVKLVEMDKMERKKTVLLTLIDDWQKLCKESLSKLKVKNNPYTVGFIRGELKAILIMRAFIKEAWRQ